MKNFFIKNRLLVLLLAILIPTSTHALIQGLPVNQGGTGVTTITGLVKGNGQNPFTAATAGTDYQLPYWKRDAVNGYIYPNTLTDKIGIGIIVPTAPLHVFSASASTTVPTAIFEQNSGGIGIIQLGNASPSQNAQLVFNDGGDNLLTIKTNYTGGSINAIAFSPAATEVLRVRQDGRVGINITAPATALDVLGTITARGTGGASFNLNTTARSSTIQLDNTTGIVTYGDANDASGMAFGGIGKWNSTGITIGSNTITPTNSITLPSISTGIAAYNTTDQTVAYQKVTTGWNSSIYQIGSFFGTGASDASIRIGNNSSANQTVVNRYIGINSSNTTTAAAFDFTTAAISYTSANALMTNLANTTLTASSGMQGIVGINPTITQTSTAGYQALWISPFEISTGSGSKLLIDAGTNSAANGSGTHTSKFSVNDAGVVSMNFDNSNATTFATSSIGNMTIAPSGGNLTVTGTTAINGGFSAGNNSGNIFVVSANGISNQTVSQYQYASSTTNAMRTGFYGSTSSSLLSGSNYSGVIFGNAPITTFTSGTHAWLANVVVKPIGTVTNSGATVGATASLYVDGAGSGGANNYAMVVASGSSFFNGNVLVSGLVTANAVQNPSGANNSNVSLNSTGTVISRNVADANSALIVNQINASSTGLILDAQFGGTSKLSVDTAGKLSIAGSIATASTQTVVNCSTSGTVTFSEPLSGSSYKVVMAYENACLGTASYTYPTAFVNTPDSLGANAARFTSISTSAVTTTGVTTTGFSQLYGY